MSAPHEVLAQLLSAAQADSLDDTGKRAWSAASGALRTILGNAPAILGVDGRLVMPEEVSGEFASPHLVVPLELTTANDQSASAYMIIPTADAAAALNSGADDPSDQEQQTIVVAATMLGQVVQSLNLQVFSASPAGLVVAVDDLIANMMPTLLATMDEPALYLTFVADLGQPLPVSLVFPGTFLDIVANVFPSAGTALAQPAADASSFSITADDLDMAELIEEEPAPRQVFAMPRPQTPVPPPQQPRRQEPPAPIAQRARFAPIPDQAQPPGRAGIELLAGLQMNVSVELGRTELTVADILGLGPGSVIELDRVAGEPVDILVNDRLIARGEVVVVDENFGVRVVEVVRRQVEQEEVVG
jgi:flagellar motor switch protein FliN